MKIILMGGFLGAGKTTVLIPLAKYLTNVYRDSFATPVVILENEISGAGVDNQLLRGQSFTVKNIFAGCICCTSSAQMVYDVRRIREQYDPACLVIEATGMAEPGKIQKELVRDGWETSVLAIADAKRWRRLRRALASFLREQIEPADVILLNKVDAADPDAIEDAKTELLACNPKALLLPFCALEDHSVPFWEEIAARLGVGKESNVEGSPV